MSELRGSLDIPQAITIGEGIKLADQPKIEINPGLVVAMKAIARGRVGGEGPALNGEVARQIMREAMTACGMRWI